MKLGDLIARLTDFQNRYGADVVVAVHDDWAEFETFVLEYRSNVLTHEYYNLDMPVKERRLRSKGIPAIVIDAEA